MLPFLKKRDDVAAVSVPETIARKPDDPADSYDMLDAVAEDMLLALEKKDKGLLKDALTALCEHLQDMDAETDKENT